MANRNGMKYESSISANGANGEKRWLKSMAIIWRRKRNNAKRNGVKAYRGSGINSINEKISENSDENNGESSAENIVAKMKAKMWQRRISGENEMKMALQPANRLGAKNISGES